MRISSARSLKSQLLRASAVVRPVAHAMQLVGIQRPGLFASAVPPIADLRPLAIGIRGTKNNVRIAVRVQDSYPGLHGALEHIKHTCRGEVDIRHVGQVTAQQQKRVRPLKIGYSVGHFAISAGTLGAFAVDPGAGADEAYILSNNHVLANENNASPGDAVLQPGPYDGGKRPKDIVARLSRFVPLKQKGNSVDAALAAVEQGMEYIYSSVGGRGELAGVRKTALEDGETVYKLGRTTGLTEGKVSALEVDNLIIGYDMGDIEFNDQIEIEPVGTKPFSKGGDSGSLVIDSKNRAVGLLFAGNDIDATYINPIENVLKALKAELLY